jgi:TolA-binding protein
MDLFQIIKSLKVIIFISVFLFFGFHLEFRALAQSNNVLVDLSKQIIEAKTPSDLYVPFSQLKELYFKDNKYAEFVEFLKSLNAKKEALEPFTDYYIALARYHQLKYLEKTQSWDEYFAKGNTYRDEITAFAKKALEETKVNEPLNLYSRLVLWQFHKDQEDTFTDQAQLDLEQGAWEYAKDAHDLAPIKKVADTLLVYREKAKARELYKVYIDRLISANTQTEELVNIALGFYNEGNLDLAQTLYDIYIDKIKVTAAKEKLLSDLADIARQFAYKDQAQNDPLYAEKIFKEMEAIGGKDIFREELIYLRGFNLEKIKEYPQAQEVYLDLLKLYPENAHTDEVNFKIGIIQTYVLRDIEKGKVYFEKLAQKQTRGPQVFSSLYQLGLINQWQGDFVKAKDYYNQLIGKLESDSSGIRILTDARLKEIEEQKPIEYNLKMFLDTSLKEEHPLFNPVKVDLKTSLYRPTRDQEINIAAVAYAGESGCMQPQLTYLWSGDLGETQSLLPDQTIFSTKYKQPGTKVINLVVMSPTGMVDRTLDMLDID